MDETFTSQYTIDFRTGRQSAIHGPSDCAGQRAACLALNRIRARGFLEADQLSPPGQSISVDVWEAAFARVARQWQLPIISLEQFGIQHDHDGFRQTADDLAPLTSVAEANPYFDRPLGVGHKLFRLFDDVDDAEL